MANIVVKCVLVGLAALFTFIWVNNTSFGGDHDEERSYRLMSHRGVHQIFAGDDILPDTCTASPIEPMRHGFIENTVPSIRAAFDAGADVVEIDIHLTMDKVFAVFHDWTLECRTNGQGQTNKALFSELQDLDVAYHYSEDGESFPLRGTGIGLVPSLTEVFEQFPTRQFLINFKSNRAEEGRALVALLEDSIYQDQVFGIYGRGENPVRIVLASMTGMKRLDEASVRSCLVRYQAYGWTGYFPASCRNQVIAVPINIAPFLWGWPRRFQARMSEHNTEVILVGPYWGNRRVLGIDSPALLDRVPSGFEGYLWTNKIEQIGSW